MRITWLLLLSTAISCSTINPVTNCTSEVKQDLWMALDQERLQADVQAIDDYLAANGITAIKHPSGLRYVITHFGTGDNLPCMENPFSTTYEGRLFKDNTIFDSSTKPVAFTLKQ